MKYIPVVCVSVLVASMLFLSARPAGATDTDTVLQENTTIVNAPAGSQSATNVNQRNLIIHEAQPTPTPKPVIANEYLTATITDNRQTVHPGEEISYHITLRNHTHQDLDQILIRLQVPRYLIPSTTDPDANTIDPARRVIEWKHQQISAGSEVRYTLRGQAENGAPDQAQLLSRVLVNGPGIHQTAHDTTTIINTVRGATTISSGPPVITDVRPTANTGSSTLPLLTAGLTSTLFGYLGTRRFITRTSA